MFGCLKLWQYLCSIVLLLSCSIFSGALGSPGLFLSYSTTTLALHNNIILIITHLSPLNQQSTQVQDFIRAFIIELEKAFTSVTDDKLSDIINDEPAYAAKYANTKNKFDKLRKAKQHMCAMNGL